MSRFDTDPNKPLQVEIFPQRLLNPETAQMLIDELNKVDGLMRAFIQGPRLPLKVTCGPGTGEDVAHPGRKVVQIADLVLELTISVGRIRLEVANADVKEEVRAACERILPFPFEFKQGFFFHNKATVSDYAKHGPDADPSMLGMMDPKASANDQVCILGAKE